MGQNSIGSDLERDTIAPPKVTYDHNLNDREGRSIIKALSCQYDIRRGGWLTHSVSIQKGLF